MFSSGGRTHEYFKRANEIFSSGGWWRKKKLKRENENVLIRGWDIRLFQTSKWDLLVRGLVMKRKFETREWDVLARGEDKIKIWNERMRFSRQGGGNQRIFEASKWDPLIRGVMWFWKYFLNIIFKPNQWNSEKKFQSSEIFSLLNETSRPFCASADLASMLANMVFLKVGFGLSSSFT